MIARAMLLLVVLLPAPAKAWTEANVTRAVAEVRIAPDATAHVLLVCTVQIHGGWLEGLEIADLDPDLVLDPDRPTYVRDATGLELTPRISVAPGGRVQIAFRRRDAPRRGSIEVGIAYITSLAHRATEARTDGTVRVRWTLPPWQAGLDGPAIHLIAPRGARPADEGDGAVTVDEIGAGAGTAGSVALLGRIEVATRDEEGATRVSWRRVHLPRTVAWSVAVDVPVAVMHPSLREPARAEEEGEGEHVAEVATAPQPSVQPARREDPWRRAIPAIPAAALILAAVLAAIGRRRRGAELTGLVPGPAWLRGAIAFGLAGASGWLATMVEHGGVTALGCLVAAVALLLVRTKSSPGIPRLGVWRPAQCRELRRARWALVAAHFGPAAWGDATTVAGATLALGALGAAAWWLPGDLAWSVAAGVVPIVVTGTRRHTPIDLSIALGRLAGIARGVRADLTRCPAFALALVVHDDGSARAQEARLRVVPAFSDDGLLRLDVALAPVHRGAGGYGTAAVMIAVARTGSSADDALAAAFPDALVEHAPAGRRIARIIPFEGALAAMIAPLLERMAAITPVAAEPGADREAA